MERYAREARVPTLRSHHQRHAIICPSQFSFIESPEEALGTLATLIAYAKNPRTRKIFIDQEPCVMMDLCANSAASVLAIEITHKYGISFEGRFPGSVEQREIVAAAGLPKALGLKIPEPPGFINFELTRGEKGGSSPKKSNEAEVVTTRLAQYVDQCLGKCGYKLSNGGKDYLCKLVGEVLTNAEDHSGTREWWVAGYMRQREHDTYGDCHITILNFGKTLHASLADLPADSLLRQHIESLVREHTRRGAFGQSSHWTPEDLWALYALQEGVSRHNVGSQEIGGRGIGTADMIEFFQQLGRSKAAGSDPKMCIVSGNTHFLFDGKYRMEKQQTKSGEARRIIAFNAENDLHLPPDRSYVRRLRGHFPGTLISLRFYLDKEHLDAMIAQT